MLLQIYSLTTTEAQSWCSCLPPSSLAEETPAKTEITEKLRRQNLKKKKKTKLLRLELATVATNSKAQ